jgi:nitroreductase
VDRPLPRRCDTDPYIRFVGLELIRKILEAGVCAPSGGNMQRWRFLVIRDPKGQGDGRGLVQALLAEKAEIEKWAAVGSA